MPSAFPLPEFLTSRRHLATAGVGLAVIAVLSTAVVFAPGPGVARPVAAAPAAVSTGLTAEPDVVDVPTSVAIATVTATLPAATAPSAAPTPNGPAITALAAQGIPIVALDAYRRAAQREQRADPSCHLPWTLIAAIGAIESGHGTHTGARLYADGQDLPRVIGPVLDGTAGNARILDTDKGVLDGDKVYDRAVGPMQFIPGTWATHGVDGNGDGRADPFNIVDAAATTAAYLCAGDRDLATDAGRQAAVFSYNHLDSYVATVLALEAVYAGRPVTTTSPSPAAPPATPTPTRTAPTPSPTPTRPSATPTTPRPTPTPTCPTVSPTATPTASPTTGPSPTPTGCTTPPSVPTSPSGSPSVSSTGHATGGSPAAGTVTPTPTPTPAS